MHKVGEVLLLMGAMFCGVSVGAQTSPGNPQVTVSVYNDSDISDRTLLEAERIATRVFRQAAIDVEWVNIRHSRETTSGDPQASQTALTLRVVPSPLTLTTAAFGVAFLAKDGSGHYADVFYTPVQKLCAVSNVSASTLLAHVMAHEIGHLLLGSNAHAPLGMMRAHWESGDLRRAAMGELLFTSEQSQRMRGRLLTRARLDFAKLWR